MSTFLLELRTEEIPANALPGARRQLEQSLGRGLAEAGFAGAEVRVLSTSRRLAAVVENLPERQPDRTEEMTGPPVRVAFSDDGTPTKAAEGFARKAGLPVDRIGRISTDKGEYLAATVTHPGRPTADILGEIIPPIFERLRFPKMMRWGLGEYLFVRPVHGVVALLDGDLVELEIFGVAAGRSSVGHRVHDPATFELAGAEGYVEALEGRGVVVDPDRRREMLEASAGTLAAEAGARVHPDPALLAEHVELVEYPGLLRGDIDPEFLELPPEVVVSTLRHHQKCLILESEAGELEPHFLAVVDRRDDPEGLVRQGNEWVIGARLADAGFFFAEDRKTPLPDRLPELERVEWHRVLGSLAAKADRVGELAGWLSEKVGAGVEVDTLSHITNLAKADLMTYMVGEFPELQGVMGGHYLRLDGAPEGAWLAVRDHYRPIGFEGELPASTEGRLVGAADRLDTVTALFAVGEIPTGSKDPFALRRAAQGVVRIAAESDWDVDLSAAVARASKGVCKAAGASVDEVATAVDAFLADRVRRYLTDLVGVAGDTAEAVMAAGWGRVPDVVARAKALEEVRQQARFRALALAFKRVKNITEGEPDAGIDPQLLAEPDERELYDAAGEFHERLAALLPARELGGAFAAMGELAEILDRFFETVLVMAEDPAVRANRVALLKSLGRDFLALADLSKLQVEGDEKK